MFRAPQQRHFHTCTTHDTEHRLLLFCATHPMRCLQFVNQVRGIAVIYTSDTVGQIFKIWTSSDSTLAITATINRDGDDAAVQEWNEGEAKEKMTQVYANFSPEVQDLNSRILASSICANAVCDMECLEI